MTGQFNDLYKIEKQTLTDISRAICEKRGLPYHEIPVVSLGQQIRGLENLCQTVPNSMLADHYVWIARNVISDGFVHLTNDDIALLDSYGYTPMLATAETSNKPVFVYSTRYMNLLNINNNTSGVMSYAMNGYYVGNYIT